jgi:hypothetical protein
MSPPPSELLHSEHSLVMMENLWCQPITVIASFIDLRCQTWRNLMIHCRQTWSSMKWLSPQICEFAFLTSGPRERKFLFTGIKNLNLKTNFMNQFETAEMKWFSLLKIRDNTRMRELLIAEFCGYLFR